MTHGMDQEMALLMTIVATTTTTTTTTLPCDLSLLARRLLILLRLSVPGLRQHPRSTEKRIITWIRTTRQVVCLRLRLL